MYLMTIYTINVYCCSILNVNAFEYKNSGFAICTRQTALVGDTKMYFSTKFVNKPTLS